MMDSRDEAPKDISAKQTKDTFYTKSAGLFTFTFFNPGENPLAKGRHIHIHKASAYIMDELNAYPQIENFDLSYHYILQARKLFFVRNKELEEVNIIDKDKFHHDLLAVVDQPDELYDMKFCTFDEIKKLITENGGHEPYSVPKMHELNYDVTRQMYSDISLDELTSKLEKSELPEDDGTPEPTVSNETTIMFKRG